APPVRRRPRPRSCPGEPGRALQGRRPAGGGRRTAGLSAPDPRIRIDAGRNPGPRLPERCGEGAGRPRRQSRKGAEPLRRARPRHRQPRAVRPFRSLRRKRMNLESFLYGIYPYLAGTVFLIGSWIRFDREQYTWKTDSTQLLSKRNLRVGSNLFHIGIIAIFFGHLIGLLTPHSVFLALGVSDMAHQNLAIAAGSIFGTLCLIGGTMLWLRRVTNPRVRAAGRRMD